jgi:signal transduction histidine kinase
MNAPGSDSAATPLSPAVERSILIVDDDADFAASLAGLLVLEGYRVVEAHDGDTALACLAREPVAVALVDVRLGTGDGIDVVRRLRKSDPDLVCVMITAYASVETAVEALQAGAYDYLMKPFHSEDLLATLNRCFERIQLLRDKARSAERLGQAQRMQAMGQLTSGIAHDFNNVLAVLLSNLRLLEERVSSDEDLTDLVSDALAAVSNGTDLTTRLLRFGQPPEESVVRVDLSRELPGIVRVLERTLGEQIDIQLEMEDGPFPAEILHGQLETGLLNLAFNARDAMPEGGTIVFRLERRHLGRHAETATAGLMPGDYCVLSIRDTGEGMTPAVRMRALDPLFTTKPAGAGCGLGLPMVDNFLRHVGGRLGIDSAPGAGTTVSLYLPLVSTPPSGGAKT